MEFAGTGPEFSGKQLSLLTSLPFTTGRDVFWGEREDGYKPVIPAPLRCDH